MTTKENVINKIKNDKMIVVVRRVNKELLCDFGQALVQGGARLVELAFDQTNLTLNSETAKEITQLATNSNLVVGAGTVLTETQLQMAIDAGAKYVVSPVVNRAIIESANKKGIVVIPGAFTPTEIEMAYKLGGDFVKLFPYNALGVEYLRSVLTPLKHIPLVAMGGILPNNVKEILNAGAQAVGVAGGIVNLKKINEEHDFEYIVSATKNYVNEIKN